MKVLIHDPVEPRKRMSEETTANAVTEHPMRLVLNQEVHARPYEWLEAPVYLANLAFLSDDVETERALLRDYCTQHQIELPTSLENFFSASVGNTRLRWERHTEFSSYTFMVNGGGETPFARSAVAMMPDGWLEQIPGQMLVAVDVVLEAQTATERTMDEVTALFGGNTVAGSIVIDEAATVYSDFHLHAQNHNRFLVQDMGLRQRQAGRLVQRLLEIEAYRMLSLMGLPLAREVTPELAALENQLVALTERMTAASDMATDQGLLGELTRVAAKIEQIAARTEYRFSATEAYFALVNRRVGELREARIPGVQTIAEFMERRLVPAVKTCDAVSKRVQGLSKRVSRASNLLRTRVDISMEAQSRDLLDSMNRRAELQLRLQETVEGLSVVVLSYYGVGLVGYLLKAIKAAGAPLNVDLLTGLSVPVVIGLVFFGVHQLRKRVEGRDKKFN